VTSPITSMTTSDGVTIASLAVEIDLANAAQIYGELLRGVPSDSRGLVVDLSAVRYLDSAGIRSFFDLARELQISRQVIALVVAVESPLPRLVKITRLDEVAIVSSTVEGCLEAID
jgi:anti-anti-sigma factor